MAGGILHFLPHFRKAFHFFLIGLNKRKASQVGADTVKIHTRKLFRFHRSGNQFFFIHISLADIAKIHHEDDFMALPLLFTLLIYRTDGFHFRLERHIRIADQILYFRKHGRTDEPLFRFDIFQFLQIRHAGIANHGKAARQISFRQFGCTAACLRHAHDADTVIGTQLSDNPRIFFNPFQVYFQPGIHMPSPEKPTPSISGMSFLVRNYYFQYSTSSRFRPTSAARKTGSLPSFFWRS